MCCLSPLFWLNLMILLSFIAVDARLTGLGLPVAPSTVPGNRSSPHKSYETSEPFTDHHLAPYTISNSPAYLYPNVTTAAPYNYPNATGTALNPVRGATDRGETCAGPNGEKGQLRKRLISVYASSGSPQPSSGPMLVVECSIENHVQPEASVVDFLPKANEMHVTEDNPLQQQHITEGNLLGVDSTSTPTVTTPSAEYLGDTLEMDYGPAKSTSARSTSAKTFAAGHNVNDLTDLQMSRLHAVLQPAQTDMPNMSTQSLQTSSSNSELPTSSSVAPPQVSSWNSVSTSAPYAANSKVPNTDGSSNAALGGAHPTGRPEGAESSKGSYAPKTPEDVPTGASPNGGSSSQSDKGASAQPGAESSNVGSSKADSAPGSVALGGGASVSVSSGLGSSSAPSLALGSIETGSQSSASGSDFLPGSPSSVIPDSGINPSVSGTVPGSTSGSSNTGSNLILGAGSNNGGSIPQVLPPSSDSNALGTSPGPSPVGIIAIESQSYTVRQTGSFVVVGSNTITQGSPAATIGSTPVSVGGNGVLVAGSDTLALNQAAGQTDNIITIGSHSYTAQQAASFFVVGSNTVVQGGPAITIASVPVSLGVNGLLLAGSNTVKVGPLPTEATGSSAAGVITIGSSPYTVQQAGSSVVLGTNTIAPEAPAITIASEPISLGTNGLLVAGSNSMTLGSIPSKGTESNVGGVITIASVPYSVLPTDSPFVVVGSNTISKGAPAVTIASEPISLGTNGILMAGSNTLALGSQATGGLNSVPNAIMSQGGPVPGPPGNPASKGGSSSNKTGANSYNAGGRLWDAGGRWTWTVGAGTVIAIVAGYIL